MNDTADIGWTRENRMSTVEPVFEVLLRPTLVDTLEPREHVLISFR